MDLKEIQNLIRFVAKSGASEVKLETGDVKITIKTGQESETTIVQQMPVAAAPVVPAAPAAPVAPVAEPAPARDQLSPIDGAHAGDVDGVVSTDFHAIDRDDHFRLHLRDHRF